MMIQKTEFIKKKNKDSNIIAQYVYVIFFKQGKPQLFYTISKAFFHK